MDIYIGIFIYILIYTNIYMYIYMHGIYICMYGTVAQLVEKLSVVPMS